MSSGNDMTQIPSHYFSSQEECPEELQPPMTKKAETHIKSRKQFNLKNYLEGLLPGLIAGWCSIKTLIHFGNLDNESIL